MSVIDDIENRVNELSDSAVKKTKEATEIMRLKSYINEEEKRIKNVFAQIGELFYTKKDEAMNEIHQLCQSIDEGKEKIDNWKKEILVIKKIVECPSCGHENPDSASFCLKCGTKLVKSIDDGKHCQNCGAPLVEGQLFCTRCGTKVEKAEEVVEQMQEETVVDETPVVEEAVIEEIPVTEEKNEEESVVEEKTKSQILTNCPKCGKEIKPGQLFCTGCGADLKNIDAGVIKEETKKEKVCPTCHSPIKEGQKFCVVCGEKVEVTPKKVEVTKKICPNCGLEIDGSKDKCDICGTNLNEPPHQTPKCPKCGKEIKPGQLFCTGCGTKLS